ncbi:hypothetical protein V3481_005853 [Fusarium oxysporum f. sp. vasinfectum]
MQAKSFVDLYFAGGRANNGGQQDPVLAANRPDDNADLAGFIKIDSIGGCHEDVGSGFSLRKAQQDRPGAGSGRSLAAEMNARAI